MMDTLTSTFLVICLMLQCVTVARAFSIPAVFRKSSSGIIMTTPFAKTSFLHSHGTRQWIPPQKPLFHPHRRRDPVDIERHLIHSQGLTHIVGCDESGSGCVARPLIVASCTVLASTPPLTTATADSVERFVRLPPPSQLLQGVDDCKRLTVSERERIYQHVIRNTDRYYWSIAVRSNEQIDLSASVLDATIDAFQESIEKLLHQLSHRLETSEKLNHGTTNSIYCIVDGHKAPKVSVSCRPILAPVTRDRIIAQLQEQHPEYAWCWTSGGYPSREHRLALQRCGPSPFHRRSCRPVQQQSPQIQSVNRKITVETSRKSFLNQAIQLTTLILLESVATHPPSANAMTTDPKTGISLPDVGEIESSVPTDWSTVDNPLQGDDSGSALSRLDSSSDAAFYKEPRFVEHVDEQAVQLLTDYVSHFAIRADTHDVLDLCSSWTSHYSSLAQQKYVSRFAGLGMNAQELQRNAALTEWVVQDLNQQPHLPYEDNSFDCVLCQLSIDYLTRPFQVCQEISRVLKPGGTVHILFSNRLFLSKAVAIWTGADDIDHAFTVASYLHFCGGALTNIQARDLSKRGKNKRIVGDPLYVVTATKGKPTL